MSMSNNKLNILKVGEIYKCRSNNYILCFYENENTSDDEHEDPLFTINHKNFDNYVFLFLGKIKSPVKSLGFEAAYKFLCNDKICIMDIPSHEDEKKLASLFEEVI